MSILKILDELKSLCDLVCCVVDLSVCYPVGSVYRLKVVYHEDHSVVLT